MPLVALALLCAIVTGVALATAAGARRTSTALDRFVAKTNASDLRVQVNDAELVAKTRDQLRATAGVGDISSFRIFPVDAGTPLDFSVLAPDDPGWLHSVDAPLVVEGRLPALDDPHEVVINTMARQMLRGGAGSKLQIHTFTQADLETAIAGGAEFPGFNGPVIDLRIVGVVRVGEDLEGSSSQTGPNALASPAFGQTYGTRVGGFASMLAVRLARGQAAVPRLKDAVHDMVGDGVEVFTSSRDELYADSVRNADRVSAAALLAFAIVAGVVGCAIIAIAVARHVGARSDEDAVLAAVGMTRRARALTGAIPPAIAGAVGIAVGVGAAVTASPAFPIRLARLAEPDPGVDVDVVALGIGALVMLLFVVLAALVAGLRPGAARTRRRSSSAGAMAARAGLAPAMTVGLGFAFDSPDGRARSRARLGVLGVAIGVVGAIAVGVIASSLDAVSRSPGRWGWTWSSTPDAAGEYDAVLAGVAADRDVAAVALLSTVAARFGGQEVQSFSVTPRKGTVALGLRSGRAPTSPDEVALGARTAKKLHASAGGAVTAETGDGSGTRRLVVVGIVVLPTIDNPEPGDGALLTPEGQDAVRQSDGSRSVAVRYRHGAPTAAVEKRLEDAGLVSFSAYSRPRLPGRIGNLRNVAGVIRWLAVFLALLGVAALTHAVLTSARIRRRDQAILRAIGFRRRQVRSAMRVEAVALAVVAIVPGALLGVAAGNGVWRLITRDWGVLDRPSMPATVLAVLVPAALAVALAAAAIAGRRLTATAPARVLQTE